MTANQFNYECISRLLNPEIVIENENIQQALRIRDDGYVVEVLETEF